MFEIKFILPRNEAGETPRFLAEVPALPPVGAFIQNEQAGYAGYVADVTYWWNEYGDGEIQVRLR